MPTSLHQKTCGPAIPAILDRNWQTTAAVATAVATGGVGGALLLAAFPAQTITAGATIGGLAYAGQRRHEGKSPLPFLNDEDKADDTAAKTCRAAA